MNKKKLLIARNKIDQLDKKILYLIKKRKAIVNYMLNIKQFKKDDKTLFNKISEISDFLLLELHKAPLNPR